MASLHDAITILPSTVEVVGTDPRFKPIPPAWADVPQGFSVFPDHQDGRDLYVYRGRIGGNEYLNFRVAMTLDSPGGLFSS